MSFFQYFNTVIDSVQNCNAKTTHEIVHGMCTCFPSNDFIFHSKHSPVDDFAGAFPIYCFLLQNKVDGEGTWTLRISEHPHNL